MAAMPTRIQVGPWRYTVIAEPAHMLTVNMDADSHLAGQADHYRRQITIDPTGTPDSQRETLVHEFLHTLMEQTRLNKTLDDKHEETVSRLSPALLDALRRNPALVAYLTAEDA